MANFYHYKIYFFAFLGFMFKYYFSIGLSRKRNKIFFDLLSLLSDKKLANQCNIMIK